MHTLAAVGETIDAGSARAVLLSLLHEGYITEREARIRRHDFEHVENEMSLAEAKQEASRCLRCDYFGCGAVISDTETVYGLFDK